MSSDREPLLGYESGRLFNIASISTMDRLFRGGYSPVVSERWIDEDILAAPGNNLLGFHRPERGGHLWTPKPGEEGKISTVYLIHLDTPKDTQPFYLIPEGEPQNSGIGISKDIAPFLTAELEQLLESTPDGKTLAHHLRLDALLKKPSGTPAEISNERQEAVLAYLDEYLRL